MKRPSPEIVAAVVAIWCRLAGVAHAAGMNSHTMVGHRVAKYYGKVTSSRADLHNGAIQRNLAAIHAGADFPDFLYACGSYKDHHDAGEAAHWPPWHAAAAKYIRSRPDFQSGEWSVDTERLVAFLYGVSVHYISDEFWEGLNAQLGRGQGFVRFLSSFNLNHTGTDDNDEGVANIGADFFASWAMDESEILPWRRYWPLQEIADIYHVYNYSGVTFKDVTIASLEECRVVFDLGLWAEKEFGQFLFHIYTEHVNSVPMIAERVLDIPVGGLDDMAVWSAWVWERIARWLEDGPPDNPSPNVQRGSRPFQGLRASKPPPDHDEADQWLRQFVQSLRRLKEHAEILMPLSGRDLIEHADPSDPRAGLLYRGPPELRGVLQGLLSDLASLASRGAQEGGSRAMAEATRFVEHAVPKSAGAVDEVEGRGEAQAGPQHTEEGAHPVGYFGSALCSGDFDGDGQADLAAGAYGAGVPGSPQEGLVRVTYASGSKLLLQGPMTHSRFGAELVVLDLDADGVDDLAVAAPTASWDGTLPISDSTPHVRFWGKVYVYLGQKGLGLATSPSLVVSTKDDLTGLGMALSTGDLNGDGLKDLLIGCPMSSFVADPTWSPNDAIQRGALFGFLAGPARKSTKQVELDARNDADLRLEGLAGYSWFGQSSAVAESLGRRMLLVGAPGQRAINASAAMGRLHLYVLSGAEGGKVQAELAATVTGSEILAEFGHSIAVQPTTGQTSPVVAIASPAAGAAASGLLRRPRAGEVRLVAASVLATLVANHTRGGAVADAPADQLPVRALISGSSEGGGYGRLGWHMGFGDVLGDSEPELIIGAPLQSGGTFHPGAREVGRIYLWDGAALPEGHIADVQRSASWTSLGSRARARLGSAFAALGSSGNRTLAVGSPRADVGGLEMAGAVDTFDVSTEDAEKVARKEGALAFV